MLRIRLSRMGSNHKPFYRIVVSDSLRTPRARVVEAIGHYNPRTDPAQIQIDVVRADHWISKDPKGLKSAAVAWAGRFPGDDSGDQAVVYSMPWTNPRPDVPVASIEVVSAARDPIPVVIAVTGLRPAGH